MAKPACGAPATKVRERMTEYQRVCARPAFTWTVTKGGHTEQLVRCNEHASQLRKNGFIVDLAVSDKEKEKEKTAKREWDMTSTNSMEAGAEYLRKKTGAVLVLVLRAQDAVVVVDEGVNAPDVPCIISSCLHEAIARLEKAQEAKRGSLQVA